MTSGDVNFNYFLQNQLIKLAHLVQFKRVLILGNWGRGKCWSPPPEPPLAMPLAIVAEVYFSMSTGRSIVRLLLALTHSRS